jgi:hypothetical protein
VSAAPPPFVVLALPRSRTKWLSAYLTYGGWHCGHDELRHARSLDDVRSWLSLPLTGTVETAGAPFWRLLRHYRPDARIAVIRRPVDAVLASLVDLELGFDPARLKTQLRQLDRKLDQIEARCPDVLSLSFDALREQAACARLFEHCLGLPFDQAWWAALAPIDLQIDLAALLRYYHAHEKQLAKVAKQAKHRTLTLLQPTPREHEDGVTFQVERFATSYAEAGHLLSEHLVQTDQSPDDYLRKNLPLLARLDDLGALQILTARSNGRMFGYLVTVVSPSLDSPDKIEAQHTIFFASPAIRNLGMRLQRASLAFLRERGVTEVIMRAGHRGAGPRLGTFYRRLGAEEFGQLYRLELEEAA